MKLDGIELSLLFDYYGDLLTQKQQICFDLYYNQDLSLGEIAQETGVSRQCVHDSIARAESALRTMEQKTGTVARDQRCHQAAARIQTAAKRLLTSEDDQVRLLAEEILAAADTIKE